MNPAEYLDELRARLQNPAISDPDLILYIEAAFRDVSTLYYTAQDYRQQVLDSACQRLFLDNKFPEISSISGGGASTNFSANNPNRYKEVLAGRRQAAWMLGC